jgi:hypothetical protein
MSPSSRLFLISSFGWALSGCGPSLEGNWDGTLTCGGIPFEFEFVLDADTNKIYTGTGTKYREFTNIEGQTIEEYVAFDILFERLSASGEQDLVSVITCTAEDKKIDGQFIEGVVCEPYQFDDWAISWDGADLMSVTAPLDADGIPICFGDIAKIGTVDEEEPVE